MQVSKACIFFLRGLTGIIKFQDVNLGQFDSNCRKFVFI